MKIILLLTTAFLGIPAMAGGLKHRNVRLADCPPAVVATAQAHLRGGKLGKIKRVSLANQTVFLVEVDLPGKSDLDLQIGADGRLLESREDISLDQAPEAVRVALARFEGKLDDLRRHTQGTTATYHVEIERKEQPDLELIFAADGSVISQQEEIDD